MNSWVVRSTLRDSALREADGLGEVDYNSQYRDRCFGS